MITQRIIHYMDIDTRRVYGILPGKIDEARCWSLWYLLKSHDGLIYDTKTQTLYNFYTYPKLWSIHRPVELSSMVPEQPDSSNWCMTLFNLDGKSFTTEIFHEGGGYQFLPNTNKPWVTELKVLLK